jgi:hypothetical protein
MESTKRDFDVRDEEVSRERGEHTGTLQTNQLLWEVVSIGDGRYIQRETTRMSVTNRRPLVAAVKRLIVPEFQSRGFELNALSPRDHSSQLRTAFPLGRLRRSVDGFCDMVDIQFHPRGKAAFRITAGRAPVTGIQHEVVGHVSVDDLISSQLSLHFLAPSKFLDGGWFTCRRLFGGPGDLADIDNSVLAIAKEVVPQIDAALLSGVCGKDVRRMGR